MAFAPSATLRSRAMPALRARSLVVFGFVVAVTATSQGAHPRASAAPQDEKAAGRAEFDRVCKACHGPEAQGDAGPRLVPFSRSYEELLGIVREGSGQMPPISPRTIGDEGVAQIRAYLMSLSGG
jgi:mono/diheme cytochrome c family protein